MTEPTTPPPVEPAVEAAPVVEPVQPGPWSEDANSYFGEDEAAKAAFDRYMREVAQPRITQLEQGSAPARELWDDLNGDPATTLRDLVASVYGDEFASQYEALFSEEEAAEVVEAVEAATSTDDVPEWAKPIVEKHLAEQQTQEAQNAADEYAAEKDALRARHADLTDDDMGLIDAFIYAAGGDMEQGYVGYQAFKGKFMAANGVAPAAPADPALPPVLGTAAAPASTPPAAPQFTKYDQLDDALESFMSEQRTTATPPPIVG